MEIKNNVILSMVRQNLVKIPGVDKKAKHIIGFENNIISICFSPISYLINIFEIAKRVQMIIHDNLYKNLKKDIIINVRVINPNNNSL
ncbi:MAG: hypothetical protein LBS95_01580 [Mycoplasmataceae bacterium]|jgi:hypothetical protein|nr:hypothetical protein [Mycoplasmataceae bacterium]